jgi:hypothetical protein
VAKGRKYGGRKFGTPNKLTGDSRSALGLIVQRNIPALESWLLSIRNPAQRCDVFLKLMAFCVPRMARTEVTAPDGKPLQVESRNALIDAMLALIPTNPDPVKEPPKADDGRKHN